MSNPIELIIKKMMELENASIPSYEERMVGNDIVNNTIIDTVAITDDIEYKYETAIAHPEYHNNEWILVDHYKSLEEAKTGHDKWIGIATKGLPIEITEVLIGDLEGLVEPRTFKRGEVDEL